MAEVGSTLRRVRLEKGIAIEEAENSTRIPRKYLAALEENNYSILPAPVYARGFLRSYASYLGLDPQELLPYFPITQTEETRLEPLTKVKSPKRTYSANSLMAFGAVAALLLAVVALYSFGQGSGGNSLLSGEQAASPQTPIDIVRSGGVEPAAQGGGIQALTDFAGLTVAEAANYLNGLGVSYVIIGIDERDIPKGQVVDQAPAPGEMLRPGQTVNIVMSR